MQKENNSVPALLWKRHGRGPYGSSRSDPEKNDIRIPSSLLVVVSIYQAGADHRDSPGLVLTCVCDAALARGRAQG
jgi:hypothetical protein